MAEQPQQPQRPATPAVTPPDGPSLHITDEDFLELAQQVDVLRKEVQALKDRPPPAMPAKEKAALVADVMAQVEPRLPVVADLDDVQRTTNEAYEASLALLFNRSGRQYRQLMLFVESLQGTRRGPLTDFVNAWLTEQEAGRLAQVG